MSDLISRQEAMRIVNETDCRGLDIADVKKVKNEVLKRLVSIPSAEKVGEWILMGNEDDYEMSYICSCCRQDLPEDYFYKNYENGRWVRNDIWNYCPNCGARMEERKCLK